MHSTRGLSTRLHFNVVNYGRGFVNVDVILTILAIPHSPPTPHGPFPVIAQITVPHLPLPGRQQGLHPMFSPSAMFLFLRIAFTLHCTKAPQQGEVAVHHTNLV